LVNILRHDREQIDIAHEILRDIDNTSDPADLADGATISTQINGVNSEKLPNALKRNNLHARRREKRTYLQATAEERITITLGSQETNLAQRTAKLNALQNIANTYPLSGNAAEQAV